jgi:photosystem II stability/assembly factor-like uncharacterized protein
MNKKILLLFIIGLSFASTMLHADLKPEDKARIAKIQGDLPEIAPGKVVVKFKSNAAILANNPKQRAAVLQGILPVNIENLDAPFENSFNTEFKDEFGISRIFEIELSEDANVYDIVNKLNQRADVEYAEPVYARYIYDVEPNDPGYATQYAPKITDCPRGWDISTGEDVLIAVVDNGVFYDHPDLEANMWVNEADPIDGEDNDNNGFVDDYRGWDFVGNSNGGQFYPDNDPKPTAAGVSHGTHVSGCAAAVGNNEEGVIGPAFNAKIMPVKCGSDNPQMRSIFEGYKGILYAAQMGADIINCSWGGPGYSQAEQDLVNQALSYGAIILAAAGNDGNPMAYYSQYPAMLDGIISIGASTSSDGVAYFSNYGYPNCVYAPGAKIYSTMPPNTYGKQDGTSMACPVAAGIAGMVKSIHPEYTWKEMYHQLRSTSEDVFSGSGDNKDELRLLYFGRINAYYATYFNNPDIDADPVPGISVSEMTMANNAESLTYIGEHNITLKIKNYLGDAENLSVELIAYDNFIELDYSEISAEIFESKEEMTIPVKVTLTENNPWYDGSAKILLRYKAARGYDDLEMIEIPIYIPSVNNLGTKAQIPENYYVTWVNSYSPEMNSCWFGGYSAFNYSAHSVVGGSSIFNLQYQGEMFSAAFAFDKNHGMFGTNRGNIYTSTDGGTNYAKTNVGHITQFVNDIYFFNDSYGIIIGDPMNGKWGIGYTTDAGKSWSKINAAPAPGNGESGLAGSFAVRGNGVWFGSQSGRVYRSTNRGQNWSEANTIAYQGRVIDIAFYDEQNGLAIYADSQSSQATKIAKSTDGGKKWKVDVFDFAELRQRPISLSSPEDSEFIFAHTSLGRVYMTSDLGNTWVAIPAKESIPTEVSTGAFAADESKGQIISAGEQVSIFSFDYSEPNPSITYVNDNPTIFDTTVVGKADTKLIKFENTGNTMIQVLEASLEMKEAVDGEFSIVTPPAYSCGPGEKLTARLKFTPSQNGDRTAVFTLKTSVEEFKINLNGFALPNVSVTDSEMTSVLSADVTPNPVSEKAILNYELDKMADMDIELYNEVGEVVKVIFEGKSQIGLNQLSFNCAELAAGVYFVRLSDGNSAITKKIIVE